MCCKKLYIYFFVVLEKKTKHKIDRLELDPKNIFGIKKMPSKNANDVLAVEELVHEIKENLRLKSRPSHHQSNRSSRPSPYHIPCRSWSEPVCDKQNNKNTNSHRIHHTNHLHNHHKLKTNDEDTIDDPYELLQALIKNNSLVKEAVRRLQLNISPKQRYFYESDEESRSPIIRMCHLEL